MNSMNTIIVTTLEGAISVQEGVNPPVRFSRIFAVANRRNPDAEEIAIDPESGEEVIEISSHDYNTSFATIVGKWVVNGQTFTSSGALIAVLDRAVRERIIASDDIVTGATKNGEEVSVEDGVLKLEDVASDQQVQGIADRVEINAADIEGLRQDIAGKEHFRGYFSTAAEIQALPDPDQGDFAYNAETGTKWAYSGTAWEDTLSPVPDQTVPPSDSTPLMDGEAAAGTENKYARGDHRHGSDTSRVKKAGDTMTGKLTAPDVAVSPGKLTAPRISMNSATEEGRTVGSGINWYAEGVRAWQTYLGLPSYATSGYHGNITPSTGQLVTGWAVRNLAQATSSSYGWIWEKLAAEGTAAETVAELNVSGHFRTIGNIYGATINARGTGASDFYNKLRINASGQAYPYDASSVNAGMYGIYSLARIGHIWSMGVGYSVAADGSTLGNLYGLAFYHTNNGGYGTMAGGHQALWAVNGVPKAALGANGVWAAGGFYKEGSSDDYLLLGGGGHRAVGDFAALSASNASYALSGTGWKRIGSLSAGGSCMVTVSSGGGGKRPLRMIVSSAGGADQEAMAANSEIVQLGGSADIASRARLIYDSAGKRAFVEVEASLAGQSYICDINIGCLSGTFELLRTQTAGSIPEGAPVYTRAIADGAVSAGAFYTV